MSHDEGQCCACMAEHRPAPLELVEHHVWPLGEGGPDDPANVVFICPTTHYNVHELLRAMKRAGRAIDRAEFSATYVQPVNLYAHTVAALGWRRMAAQSMTP